MNEFCYKNADLKIKSYKRKQMKYLTFSLLVLTSLPTFAATTYSVTMCDNKHQREVDSTVADFLFANNTFGESNYVLRSAVAISPVKKDWQKVGAVLINTGKEGTVVTGLHLCTKNSNDRASGQEHFQLEKDLKIAEVVKKGEVTLDLDHAVYMGDEHVAAPGSTLKATASDVDGQDHLVEVVIDLTLNICDVTEQTEAESEADPDCNTTHDKIKGTFKMKLPKNMRLK
jgi:hypothetical protein